MTKLTTIDLITVNLAMAELNDLFENDEGITLQRLEALKLNVNDISQVIDRLIDNAKKIVADDKEQGSP